jgi:hypothetical protein
LVVEVFYCGLEVGEAAGEDVHDLVFALQAAFDE